MGIDVSSQLSICCLHSIGVPPAWGTSRSVVGYYPVRFATDAKGPKALRGLVSFILLITLPGYYLEPEMGEVRDGAVHHESTSEAMSHSVSHSGEHGHEAFGKAPGTDFGPGHQHGTGADHCTHVHGPAMAGAATAYASYVRTMQALFEPIPTPTDHINPPIHRPPRS